MQTPARPAAWLLLLVAALQMAAGASIAKRSLSALARTSQLPNSSTANADQAGQNQDHQGAHGGQSHHDKRSMLQEEAIREELLRQHAAPATEALLSAIMAAERYDPNGVEEKRSVSSLARYGNLPVPASEKRSLEALARGGLLNKNSRIESNKRSLAALARAGELPKRRVSEQHENPQDLIDVLQRELEQEKRSLSSLAKSGGLTTRPAEGQAYPLSVADLQMKRSIESLARNWNLPEKRSIESLARNWNLPEKRSIESLARNWNLPEKRSPPYGAFDEEEGVYCAKRNAAALLRQTKFSTGSEGSEDSQRDEESERHGQGRMKRSAWEDEFGEVAAPYVQSVEQEGDAVWSPAAVWAAYLANYADETAAPMQKRFLGSVARTWGPSAWRPASPASAASAARGSLGDQPGEDVGGVSKRHIGALARSGILPAFRSLRYSRSGRAVVDEDQRASPFSFAAAPRLGRFGPVRYRRVCFYREDPEHGTPSTKD